MPLKAQEKWGLHLNKNIPKETWRSLYELCNFVTDDTKLICLQLKINHNKYYSNSRLFKCDMSTTDMCTFCEVEKETTLHLLCECKYVLELWNNFVALLRGKCNINI